MKISFLPTMALAAAVGFAGIGSASAADPDIHIRTPPPSDRRQETPWAKPYRQAVWIGGHYEPRGGTWVWIGGYYAYPPYSGAKWYQGYYRHGEWHPGRWTRRY
jgi:hypothetical protein